LPRQRATGPPRPEHPEPPPFDALALKQQAQEELLKATAGMSREEERSFYRHRARTGPLRAWWAQVEALGRAESANGEGSGEPAASDHPAPSGHPGESPDSPTSAVLERLLDRLKAAIAERGYKAVVEDLISDDLIGGDDSLLASDEVMVIPGHRDDSSRPILLALTRGRGGEDPLSFSKVMRQVEARLIAGNGAVEHVIVFCDGWESPSFEQQHREELEAHARRGVRFWFVMVGVPDRLFLPIPVGFDQTSR
jgi:hypothetical protein